MKKFIAIFLFACASAPPAPGTAPLVEVEMISPLTKETQLQIVSVFSYEPGETLISPASEIAGLVWKNRVGGFGKQPLEVVLLDPAPPPVHAKRLLALALGPRSEFSLARVRQVGRAAVHEALRLEVAEMAFAPIVRDQGVTAIDADAVAAAFVQGALAERREWQGALKLRHVTYEAGPAYVEAVKAAVAREQQQEH